MVVVRRGTNVDNNFPWHFNHGMNRHGLGVVDISLFQVEGGSPVLNTHVELDEHR